MIPKLLVGAAIALAACTGTGTASATPVGGNPNLFGALSCGRCHGLTPTGSLQEEIQRGIRNGKLAVEDS